MTDAVKARRPISAAFAGINTKYRNEDENLVWLNVYALKDEGSRVSIHYTRKDADSVRPKRIACIKVTLEKGRFDE